ncbi:MAG: reverse transcriptase domain-containing protein [Nanoarchaeota archaeon]
MNKNLYEKIYSIKNIILAWKKARKRKTKKQYVKDFEENIAYNLKVLHDELKNQTYTPKPLQTFILRDPKTRKISKSEFRDRVVHHAIVNVLEPIFDKIFIYDSCANRKGKGNLFAIKRFELFKGKITNNLKLEAFCLKADIKHYFEEINHKILINAIRRKIKDNRVIWLIKRILEFGERRGKITYYLDRKGIPLGNLTSQFFANIYLHEIDFFIKHKLKCRYYIRYVDDFIIINKSKLQLELYKKEINNFLKEKLELELHPDKSKISSLSNGIDFVGFRIFYYHRLLRKRNIKNMRSRIKLFNEGEISNEKLDKILQGWISYAKWSNSYKLVRKLLINF